jgi:hypothetical protein
LAAQQLVDMVDPQEGSEVDGRSLLERLLGALADCHKLGNLCKGLVVNLLPLTSELFKRLATSGKL